VIDAKAPAELRGSGSGGARTRMPRAAAAARGAARRAVGERPVPLTDAVKIVAWLSITAGAIHAIAMIDHFSHWWLYGAFFLVLTYGQVLWGAGLLRTPPADRNLVLGAAANLAIVAVWLFSRTIGIPIGPDGGRPEAVGVMDVAATLDQLVLAAYVALVVRPDLRSVRAIKGLIGVHRVRIGMMLCSASFFVALLGGGHKH
jgi:hypothetical protein